MRGLLRRSLLSGTLLLTPLLPACGGADGKPGETHWGDVVADRAGETASVDGLAAFGYNLGDTAVIFVVPNAAATCADAFHMLDGDPEYDPTVANPAGTCNMFVNVSDYLGGQSALGVDTPFTYSASASTPSTNSIIALNCAMDTGEWVQEQRNTFGYFYSGPYWQGSPEEYMVTVSGGDEAGYSLDVEMSSYDGNFIYESMEDAPASGSAAGSIDAAWCPDLAQTVYF